MALGPGQKYKNCPTKEQAYCSCSVPLPNNLHWERVGSLWNGNLLTVCLARVPHINYLTKPSQMKCGINRSKWKALECFQCHRWHSTASPTKARQNGNRFLGFGWGGGLISCLLLLGGTTTDNGSFVLPLTPPVSPSGNFKNAGMRCSLHPIICHHHLLMDSLLDQPPTCFSKSMESCCLVEMDCSTDIHESNVVHMQLLVFYVYSYPLLGQQSVIRKPTILVLHIFYHKTKGRAQKDPLDVSKGAKKNSQEGQCDSTNKRWFRGK